MARRLRIPLIMLVLCGLALASAGTVAAVRGGVFARVGAPADISAARERLRAEGLPMPLPQARIVVRKAERRLDLLDGDRTVRSFRIALGGEPEGHKQREGDGRTPEGTYRICTRLERSRFHLFMGLDYPAPADAAGRTDVTDAERDAIASAHRTGGVPPWGTVLGGAVGIHGGGSHRDWTLGCIAVEDAEIEELFLLTADGTPVTVLP